MSEFITPAQGGAPVNTGPTISSLAALGLDPEQFMRYAKIDFGLAGDFAAAIATGKPITLPPGDAYLSAQAISLLSLAKGATLVIAGAGSDKTRLIVDPALVANQAIALGASEAEGPLSISWPGTDGRTFVSERPTTTVSQTSTVGAYEISLASMTGIAVGDIIRIKCQRLDQRGETRNYIMRGETNCVESIDGTVARLRYPLADSYSPDTVWTGAASAGTDSSITIATGLSPDLVAGCRVRITAGPGAGQTRYITAYDPVTGIAAIDVETSAYMQDLIAPVATGASTIIVDRPAYVFVTKSVGGLAMSGFTLACTAAAPRGLAIIGVDRPYLDDIRIEDAPSVAVSYTNCIRPTARRLQAVGCNNGSLGYTVLMSGCRDGLFEDLASTDCRRGGVDTGGTTPTWGCTISGVRVVGGRVDKDGVPWSPDNPNYGIGEHGQARDFAYRNVQVEGVMVGFVQRGRNTRVDGMSVKGPMWRHIWLNAGQGFSLRDYTADSRIDPSVVPQPGPIGGEGPFLYISGSKWGGGIDVDSVNLRGLQGSLIYVQCTTNNPANQRVRGALRIRDWHADWRLPASVNGYIFDGSAAYAINGWYLDDPSYTVAGGGALLANKTLLTVPATALQNVYYRIGDTWAVSIANDSVVTLPSFLRASQTSVRIFQVSSSTTARINSILRVNSTAISSFSTSLGSVVVAALAEKPTGTSGDPGKISLHHSGSELTIENRTGADLYAAVTIEGGL